MAALFAAIITFLVVQATCQKRFPRVRPAVYDAGLVLAEKGRSSEMDERKVNRGGTTRAWEMIEGKGE